ncbi:unnamed protein product [Schistosoma curassoni]|uniref:SWIM-type domain-containing protein n=1 Tax=Schistosoma curassoni TaxID=6186 RepID=A0A183KYC7_9TREM|nr:unnamed protein product [Schistosoma curassoni]
MTFYVQANTEVKVFNENGNMSMICFNRREQIAAYHAFPEVICIDLTYQTNKVGFTRKYEHLRTHFPRAYDYIIDYWTARKSMWARCYRRHVLGLGNHTNNRVESAHKHLKECPRRGDSLLLTFWKIWSKTDIDLRLRPYGAVKDLQCFPILQVPMSFRTLLNEFTSFAAKIVAVNYKRVRTMRHEFIEGEYIRCCKGMMYVVDTSRARWACERFNDYMLPCGHILYAHSKDLIRGGMCVPLSL